MIANVDPIVTVVDESGRVHERYYWTLLARYNHDALFLTRDVSQLRPLVISNNRENNLVPKLRISLYARLIYNTFSEGSLRAQQRSQLDMCTLYNKIGYSNRLLTPNSNAEHRPDLLALTQQPNQTFI